MSDSNPKEPTSPPPPVETVESALRADYQEGPPDSKKWTERGQVLFRLTTISFTGIVILVIVGLIFPPFTGVRDASNRAMMTNNLKQIGVAVHNYASCYDDYIVTDRYSEKDGRALASWRTQLLPFLESGLPRTPDDKEVSWDSPAFSEITNLDLKVYITPGTKPSNRTQIQAFTGPRTALEPRVRIDPETGKHVVQQQSLFAGMADAIFAGESQAPVIFSQPKDIDFPSQTIPKLGRDGKAKSVQFLLFDGGTTKIQHNELTPALLKMRVQKYQTDEK